MTSNEKDVIPTRAALMKDALRDMRIALIQIRGVMMSNVAHDKIAIRRMSVPLNIETRDRLNLRAIMNGSMVETSMNRARHVKHIPLVLIRDHFEEARIQVASVKDVMTVHKNVMSHHSQMGAL